MDKIKAWIVDDESDAQQLLFGLIKTYCLDIEVVGSSVNIEDAWEGIRANKPHLVYLDMNMPRGGGLDLLERFPVRKFEAIIISAYPENKEKIVRYKDIPFLEKPFDIDDFISLTHQAIKKIRENPNQVHRIQQDKTDDDSLRWM
ncbi:MAG: hypothetical protein B7C24_07960 [Bacteroidetes bacterium 4572_77]|nr:MAG: hypothetical protein B7C24_07960 [Bacteroidetes bacterium 4572_77]